MSRFAEARDAVAARTDAVAGVEPSDDPERVLHLRVPPDDAARRLLAGELELDELQELLDGLKVGAVGVLKSIAQLDSFPDMYATLHFTLAQVYLHGRLVGKGERS